VNQKVPLISREARRVDYRSAEENGLSGRASVIEIRRDHRKEIDRYLRLPFRKRLVLASGRGRERRNEGERIRDIAAGEVREASKVPRIALPGRFNSSKAARTARSGGGAIYSGRL